jgi:hypothetical protein
MQLASNSLHAGDRVVWIDTASPIPGPRFMEILSSHSHPPAGQDPASSPPVPHSTASLLEKLTYLDIHTLPHLLVLFLHPTPSFPPPETALIVIDNISAPFATAFSQPPSPATKTTGGPPLPVDHARKSRLKWAANRKWAIAGDLAAAMNRMAVLKSLAIVTINQVTMSLKEGDRRAGLKPAMAGTAWEAAIHNRLSLWHDFAPPLPISSEDGRASAHSIIAASIRFAKVVKAGGKAKVKALVDIDDDNDDGAAVGFVIDKARIRFPL